MRANVKQMMRAADFHGKLAMYAMKVAKSLADPWVGLATEATDFAIGKMKVAAGMLIPDLMSIRHWRIHSFGLAAWPALALYTGVNALGRSWARNHRNAFEEGEKLSLIHI